MTKNWTKRELEIARQEAHKQWLNASNKEQSEYYSSMIDSLTKRLEATNDFKELVSNYGYETAREMTKHSDSNDTELLQWAGLEEFPND